MVLITIFTGVYKPTYNWGGHIVSVKGIGVYCGQPSHMSLVLQFCSVFLVSSPVVTKEYSEKQQGLCPVWLF